MEYNRSARGIDIEAKAKYDEAERIAKGLCTQLLSLRRNGELDKELVSTTNSRYRPCQVLPLPRRCRKRVLQRLRRVINREVPGKKRL